MKEKVLLTFLDTSFSNVIVQNEVQIQEKILHKMISENTLNLFDAYLLGNEVCFKQDHSLRIDSLCLTKEGKLIIIEYKKDGFNHMLTQPLAYFSYLQKYQGDVILMIQEKQKELGINIVKTNELPEISIICIAKQFSKHDIEGSKFIQQPIGFFSYTIFSNNSSLNLLLECKSKNKSFENFQKRILIELNDQQKQEYLNETFDSFLEGNFFEKFGVSLEKSGNQYTSVYFVKNDNNDTLFSFNWFKQMKTYYFEIGSLSSNEITKKIFSIELQKTIEKLGGIGKIDIQGEQDQGPCSLKFRIIEFGQHNLKFSLEKIFSLLLQEDLF